MLYNPNQGKTEKDISLADFISWLETKDPKETYNYQNKTGQCCLGQYMAARGVKWRWPHSYAKVCELLIGEGFCGYEFQDALANSSKPRFYTKPRIVSFGTCLKNVKKLQKETV